MGTLSFFHNQTIFYDVGKKKYFVLEYITLTEANHLSSHFIEEIDKGDTITAEVNIQELADNSYGARQKPVPVFAFSRDGAQHHRTFTSFLSSIASGPLYDADALINH